jgi:glycoside/pentoside/hexuronide:cation symporter, GPH family
MLIITIFIFITLSLKGGMYVYYFENYLSEKHLADFLENIGFNGFIDGLNSVLVRYGIAWLYLA